MDRGVRAAGRFLLGCATVMAGGAASDGPAIKTDTGLVQGTHSAEYPKVIVFYGLPYAAPPLGALRWKPPQPPASWTGVRRADQLSAACPQPDRMVMFRRRVVAELGGDPSTQKQDTTNEDCLYLNVMTTPGAPGERRPVMVYLHGGSGVSGRGNEEGAALADAGAVVVTLNYRLGVLGWLAHPALTAESAHGSSGNYGLLDQIAALQWIHRNIARFGGDPENVTVFGHSSGAEYVACLIISPLARGLLRAIVQSYAPFELRPSVHHPSGEVQAAEELGLKLAGSLGASGGSDGIKTLRSMPAEKLVVDALPYDLVVDGWVLPDQPLAMFARGQQADMPVMAGSTSRELSIYVTEPLSEEGYRDWAKGRFGPVVDEVLRLYPAPESGDASESFIRAGTELIIGAPVRWLAEATSKKKSRAYLYRVDWGFGTKGGQRLGAFHAIDIVLLFGLRGVPWDESGETVARTMRRYWVQFARTGDPNGSGLPAWPAYDAAKASFLNLGTDTRQATVLDNDSFRLIQRLYSERMAALSH